MIFNYRKTSLLKFVGDLLATMSQQVKVIKKASLGNSLVWLGFDWVGATGFEPAT